MWQVCADGLVGVQKQEGILEIIEDVFYDIRSLEDLDNWNKFVELQANSFRNFRQDLN